MGLKIEHIFIATKPGSSGYFIVMQFVRTSEVLKYSSHGIPRGEEEELFGMEEEEGK